MEKKVLSCEFNMDAGCVEVKYADGSMIAINCTKVENEVARNMNEHCFPVCFSQHSVIGIIAQIMCRSF